MLAAPLHPVRAALLGPLLALALFSAETRAENAQPLAGSQPMARYRQAHAAMQAGKWDEARELLLGLWQRSKSYDVAASLAQVEHALGNDVTAARYLTFALGHLAPKERPETLARYRAALNELEAKIGRVQVEVDEPAAEVRIDGELVGVSPLPQAVFVQPGDHDVEARVGALQASTRVQVGKGSLVNVALSLARPTPSAPYRTESPSTDDSRPGQPSVPADGAAPAQQDRRPQATRSLVPVYATGGLALAGAAVAVGFGLAANSDAERADALKARLGESGCAAGSASRSTCDAAERAVEVQRRDALVSNIGIGVASASLVAGLGYLLFWPAPAPSGLTARLRPSGELTRTGAALGVTGEF